MEFYLDTANVETVKRLAKILPISGVTTNPSIVAKEKRPIFDLLKALQDVLDDKSILFAQTLSHEANGMIDEALKLRECISDIVVKVPVTHEGLIAIKALTKLGVPTLGTSVYGAVQGLFSAMAGAKYVAPYVNRVDAQGGDAIAMVSELQNLLELHTPQSMVLAASFRTPRQVLDCMLCGCQAMTVGPDVAELFIQDPAVKAAICLFDQDWQNSFGQLTF